MLCHHESYCGRIALTSRSVKLAPFRCIPSACYFFIADVLCYLLHYQNHELSPVFLRMKIFMSLPLCLSTAFNRFLFALPIHDAVSLSHSVSSFTHPLTFDAFCCVMKNTLPPLPRLCENVCLYCLVCSLCLIGSFSVFY